VIDLDPHWDWIEVTYFGDPGPTWIKGSCRHLELVPVESVDGEDIARLCLTCDAQFYRGSAVRSSTCQPPCQPP
jgi:hypothetical protein